MRLVEPADEILGARAKLEATLVTPEDRSYFKSVMDFITESRYGLHAEVCWSALSMAERGYDIRESLAYGLSEWDL